MYPTQKCTYVFLYAFSEFMCILAFPSSVFFYAIIQNAHINRWMKTQLALQRYIRATSVCTTCFMQALYRINHYIGFTLLYVIDTN